MAWLSTTLLADVRRSGMLPDSAPSGVSDSDLLAHANKELQARLLPLVLSVREEFYVQQYATPLVAGQQFYRMPPRAIGSKLRDVYLVMPDGSQRRLARLTPEAATEACASATIGAYPWAYFVEQDSVMLVPTPSTSGVCNLEMKYLLRPNALITESNNTGPRVTSVSQYLPGVTSIMHTGTASFNVYCSGPLDIVSVNAPFRTVMISVTPSAYVTGEIQVPTASLPSDFTTANFGGGAGVGAVLSQAERSSVVQLPPELHNLLYQRVLCRVLQSVGDLEALQVAEANAAQMQADAVALISNRIEGDAKKVIGRMLMTPRRRAGRWY